MAYATIQDMIARFGEIEMIRLSVPDGGDLTQINTPAIVNALNIAAARIDTYLRRRYQTPVAAVPPPAELNDVNVVIALYLLSFGEQKQPSEQVRLQNKEAVAWLEGVNQGRILLADITPSGEESFAQVQDRGFTIFTDDGDLTGANTNASCGPGWPTGGFW
jgi:phage gp36-like protein